MKAGRCTLRAEDEAEARRYFTIKLQGLPGPKETQKPRFRTSPASGAGRGLGRGFTPSVGLWRLEGWCG